MLKIERLPPMALTAATVRRLGALTGPLASALANRAVAGSAKSEVPAPDAGEASGVPAIRRWRQMRWFAGSRATEPANSDAPPAKMTPTVVGR